MADLTLISTKAEGDLWAGWSRFVPRINPSDWYAMATFTSGAIAKPLHQSAMDAQLLLFAAEHQNLITVLEPEAWRNQRPHGERGREFMRAGLASPRRPVSPTAIQTVSNAAWISYIEPFLDVQHVRGAGAIVTPSHQAGGPSDPARDGELWLAELGARLAMSKGSCERDGRQLPLLVEITLDVRDLGSRAAAIKLASSYASLPGDGFWVHLVNLHDRSKPTVVDIASTFLFALQDLSDRRVFAVDCKNLLWPLMAAGLSGGCIGVATREQFNGFEKQTGGGFKASVVHKTLLRNFQADGLDAERSFKRYPCDCGAHVPYKVPQGNPDVSRHDARVRLQMAAEATSPNAVTEVRRWLADAGLAAGDLSLIRPPVAAYEAAMNASDWRAEAAA